MNKKLSVVDYQFSLRYPDYHDETLLHKIRDKLWAKPKLIDEFLDSANDLSDEKIKLLQSWRKNHIKGQFVLLKYDPAHNVFMRMDEGKTNKSYTVKGMTTSIVEAMHRIVRYAGNGSPAIR